MRLTGLFIVWTFLYVLYIVCTCVVRYGQPAAVTAMHEQAKAAVWKSTQDVLAKF
jgi:hypothetical protein